jgi:nitrile hydratase
MTDRLAPGAMIHVRLDWPEQRGPVHIRTPHYVRGRRGEVVRHLGDFANPEDLAFARPAPLLALYHVRFDLRSLWPEVASGDDVLVELYESWIEPQ